MDGQPAPSEMDETILMNNGTNHLSTGAAKLPIHSSKKGKGPTIDVDHHVKL